MRDLLIYVASLGRDYPVQTSVAVIVAAVLIGISVTVMSGGTGKDEE